MTTEEPKRSADEVSLDLNFVPKWAREPSTHNPYADFEGGRERRGEDRGGDRYGGERRARPPRRDEAPRGGGGRPDRRPRRDERGGRSERPPSSRPGEGRRESAGPRVFAGPRPPQTLPVDVSFIPDRHGLGGAVHRIQATRRAYPLAQLAHMFLSRPSLYLVKMEMRAPHPPRPDKTTAPASGTDPAPRAPAPSMFQCSACQAVFRDAAGVERHALAAHVDHFFTIEETAGEPPTGQFKCVVRCPRSGRLLGPPNHHGFNEALAEIHSERFSRETLDEYRATLEMVHEPDVIEQWKKEYSTRRVYRRKEAPAEDPPMKWMEATAWMRGQVSGLVRETRRAVTPAPVAAENGDPALRRTVREAWTREERFPMSLMLALRPALRHMGMHLFKAGGMSFVTAIRPAPINPEFAIPTIRHALDYLTGHPGTTWAQMRQDLYPGRAEADAECVALEKDLRWLVDKGHVIEFYDGTMAIPRGGSSVASPRQSAGHADQANA